MKTWFPRLINILYFLLGLSALWGQFARFSSPVGLISFYEVIMGLIIVSFGITRIRQTKLFLYSFTQKQNLPLIVFLAWSLSVSISLSYVMRTPVLLTLGVAYISRIVLYLFFAGVSRYLYRERVLSRKYFSLAVLACLLAFAALGVLQYLFEPDTRILYYLGWDNHLSRAFGTLFDPGYFGLLMVCAAIMTLWRVQKKSSLSSSLQLALFLSATALSYSRASYLALVIGVVFFAFLQRSRKLLLILPLFIMTLVLLPKDGGGAGQDLLRTETVAMRQEVAGIHTQSLGWQEVLIGRGWYYEKALNLHAQAIETKSQSSQIVRQNSGGVDNIFLQVFLCTGVIGSLLFILALLQLWRLSKNTFWKASFLAVLGHSFFSLGLFYPWIMLFLAITFFVGEEPTTNTQ